MLHERYKNTIPFSQRLNDFILKRASEIKYVEVEHGPNSLDKLRSETQRLGIMPVNTDHCDNNIFGSREINVAFRAWHDHIHLEHNLEFNLEGELRASFIQAAELPSDWYEERLLLIYEITGQALYFLSHGVFVENQRKFTNILHKTGKI